MTDTHMPADDGKERRRWDEAMAAGPVWGGAAEEFPPGYGEFVTARSRYFARGGRRPAPGPPETRRVDRGALRG